MIAEVFLSTVFFFLLNRRTYLFQLMQQSSSRNLCATTLIYILVKWQERLTHSYTHVHSNLAALAACARLQKSRGARRVEMMPKCAVGSQL